jgi:hypothetical protein
MKLKSMIGLFFLTRLKSAFVPLILGLLSLFAYADDDPNAPPNLVPNPGFERWANWTRPSDPPQPKPTVIGGRVPVSDSYSVEAYELRTNPAFPITVTIDRDGDVKHGGDYSLKITNATATDIGGVATAPIVVTPNTTYKVTFWYRGQDIVPNPGDGAGVMFWINEGSVSDFNANLIITAHPPVPKTGAFEWRPFEVTFTTAATTGQVMLAAQLRRATGTAWFDDFSMTLVPTPATGSASH